MVTFISLLFYKIDYLYCFSSDIDTKKDQSHQSINEVGDFDLNKHLEKNKKMNNDREKKTRK